MKRNENRFIMDESQLIFPVKLQKKRKSCLKGDEIGTKMTLHSPWLFLRQIQIVIYNNRRKNKLSRLKID